MQDSFGSLISFILSLLIGAQTNAVPIERTPPTQPPTPIEFDCAQWNTDEEARKLVEPIFIKRKGRELLQQICTKAHTMFALILDVDSKRGPLIRGAIHSRKTGKLSIEKFGHPDDTLCEIQSTSTASRINYLCYNPTVGAGQTTGDEYSFRPLAKKTYHRLCTVHFPPRPTPDCGKWEKATY